MSLRHSIKGASSLLVLAIIGWAGKAEAQVVAPIGAPLAAAGIAAAPVAAAAPIAAGVGTPFLGVSGIVSPITLSGLVAPTFGIGIAPFAGFAPPIATTLGLTPFLGTLNDAGIAASLLGVNNAFALQLQGATAFTSSASFSQFINAGVTTFGGFAGGFNPLLTQIGITPLFTGFADQLITAFPATSGIAIGAGFPVGFINWWIPQLQNMLSVINGILLPTVVSPILQQSLVNTQTVLFNTLGAAQELAIGF